VSPGNVKIFKKVADITVKETLGDKIVAILSDSDYDSGMTNKDLREVLSAYHGYQDGKSLMNSVHAWCNSPLAKRKGVYKEAGHFKINTGV